MLHYTDNRTVLWTYGVPLPLIKAFAFQIQGAFCNLLKESGSRYPFASLSSMPVEYIDPALLEDDIESEVPGTSLYSELDERIVLRSQLTEAWPADLRPAVEAIVSTDAWLHQNDTIPPEMFKILYVKTRGEDGDVFTCQASTCSTRVTPQSTQARDHAKTHLEFKQFQCEECPRRFVRKQDLTQHQGRHTGSRMFRCEYCNRDFNKMGNRNRHSANCPSKP